MLCELDIYGGEIGVAGARCLAEGLAHKGTIEKLCLKAVMFSENSENPWQMLVNSLLQSSTIDTLQLIAMEITDTIMQYLVDELITNISMLKTLSLIDLQQVTEAGWTRFSQVLGSQ
jgi:hypothetical protein